MAPKRHLRAREDEWVVVEGSQPGPFGPQYHAEQRKFYCVAAGRIPGIYKTYEACEAQVQGFPHAVHRRFSREQDALAWMRAECAIEGPWSELGLERRWELVQTLYMHGAPSDVTFMTFLPDGLLIEDRSSFVSALPKVKNYTGRIHRLSFSQSRGGAYADVRPGSLKIESHELDQLVHALPDGLTMNVAIKVVRQTIVQSVDSQKLKQRFQRELAVWCRLKHRNVVELLGIAFGFGAFPALISPWFQHGDAVSFLKRNPNANRLKILRGVAAALVYMHGQDPPVVHCDLKGANILVADNGEGMICDFGISKVLRNSESPSGFTTTTISGTIRFMAAELSMEFAAWTPASDVFGFAGAALQILSDEIPYSEHQTDAQVMRAILDGKKPKRPLNIRKNWLWTLLLRCWNFTPDQRPLMSEIHQKISTRSL